MQFGDVRFAQWQLSVLFICVQPSEANEEKSRYKGEDGDGNQVNKVKLNVKAVRLVERGYTTQNATCLKGESVRENSIYPNWKGDCDKCYSGFDPCQEPNWSSGRHSRQTCRETKSVRMHLYRVKVLRCDLRITEKQAVTSETSG